MEKKNAYAFLLIYVFTLSCRDFTSLVMSAMFSEEELQFGGAVKPT